MNEPTKTHHTGLDDENEFAETLIGEQGTTKKLTDNDTLPAAQKKSGKQPPWAGKIMGHFKLLRLIGEGAMGLVIQAEDTHLKRIVALKVLRKSISTGQKGQKRIDQFLREARAAAAIEHPNIVRVYEINQHEGWWYIAMEMVGASSLLDIVKAVGALPPSRACPIIADAAIGLQVAHEMGMIHRDIKPSNILVTRNGHGKVSDFGLVRVDDPNDPVDTFAHQSIGTPLYMAPEIIRRQTLSSAVDIYSLGATLYYTLTGRPPYNAENMEDIYQQHLHSAPPNLLDYLPDSSPNLASLIRRMMAKEPVIRPSAEEVAATLQAESISFLPDNAGVAGPGGSTIGADWQAALLKSRTALTGLTVHTQQQPKLFGLLPVRLRMAWQITLAAAIVLMISAPIVWLFIGKNPPRQDRQLVNKLFPDAPKSYGTKESGTLPNSSIAVTPVPSFSWKGKVDVTGVAFIASQTGQFFYPIDDKRAVLIRADQFVGYKTAEEAFKDGKVPAP
jgi:serine/threonine protein kinase